MKLKLIIPAFLFAISLAKAQNPAKVIACHVNQISFPAFCDILHSQAGVNIYYQENWVKDISVTMDHDSISVLSALTQAVAGKGLEVSVWNNALVVMPGLKLLTSLPQYAQLNNNAKVTGKEEKLLTQTEERYITGRKADVTQTIHIGHSELNPGNSKVKVLGRILDQETGEPILMAYVFISETKTGAVSDLNGFFSLLLAPDIYNMRIEYLGYEKQKFLLDVVSDGSFTVNMKKAVIQMKEFVVTGDRQMNIRKKDPGLDQVSMESIRELPMLMGERDILKVSGMLPGIVSVGEGASGLNVRGGSSDQNAFYINKVPIYNTSHLFGFFPAFNSDIIKDFSIYKGHIPAQYGGRLSSVFNIITRQGNRKRLTLHGALSPIAGNIVVDGPLEKDTCSILLSARSTYSDWILGRMKDPDIRRSSANFYDLSACVNYDIQKTQMSLFVYRSNDHFRLSDINDFTYSNNGASVSLNHNYSNSLSGKYTLIGSQYAFSTIDKQEISSAYEHAYKMGHYEARADFNHLLTEKSTLAFGAGIVLYQLHKGTVNPYGESSLLNKVDLGDEKGVESSLYLSDAYDVLPWLNVNIGMRYTLYTPTGPKIVYTYTPGGPVDARYINDTLNFGNDRIIKWYHQPDIRAAINIETDENGSVKLAFNQMHQNLFMLSNTLAIAPNTQWKLADYHLLPSRSNQVSAGIFRTMPESGLEASIEIYYKKTYNAPEFKDGADFLSSALVETSILQGDQKSYGLEFFLKRSRHKLEGWLSYTYSRAIMRINGPHAWDQINNGEAYPASFDIPHALNMILNFHLSRRITFSSIFSYQTGKPITYPVSVYYINDLPTLHYSKRNAYKIPDYMRADVSMTLEGNLNKHKLIHSSFIFSLYNALGRENPYSVFFKTENGKIKSYQYSVIGVPIFTATWSFKLGNYASD